MEKIHVTKLIKGKYQRNHETAKSKQHIKKMAETWEEEDYQDIEVSVRDGKFYVIDGFHRVSVIRIKYEKGEHDGYVRCNKHYNLTETQEARKFLIYNDELPQTVEGVFNGEIQAENPVALRMQEVFKNKGYDATKLPSLLNVFEERGEKPFSDALELYKAIITDKRLDRTILWGMVMVFASRPTRPSTLIKRMRPLSITALKVEVANAFSQATNQHITMYLLSRIK